MAIRKITARQFTSFNNININISGLCLLTFYGDNCPACKNFYPVLVEADRKYSSKITFLVVNMSDPENHGIIKKSAGNPEFAVTRVPTTIAYMNGNPFMVYIQRAPAFSDFDSFVNEIANPSMKPTKTSTKTAVVNDADDDGYRDYCLLKA